MGGEPIRQKPWPDWPRADEKTAGLLLDVLHSERWAISGMYNGKKLYERRFAEAFSAYNGVPYCVPTSSGTTALTIAMEAIGVRQGDEVLVPGLTWVACASSVTAIGAVPILVDVEEQTLCMSAEAAQAAISPRTAAIMVVHLYCNVADLDAFVRLSEKTGIPLIEDCAQAHGAMWRGRHVGTFGKIGAFSMQDSKVLTSGEGGAAITSDLVLHDRMQLFRADGRRYRNNPPPLGHPELEEAGSVDGHNMCLSEFQAAILLDRLTHLDEENRCREGNVEYLRTLLSDIGDITPLSRRQEIDALTCYQFCVRLNLSAFGNLDIDILRQALMAELNLYSDPVDAPLNENALYNPLKSLRFDPTGDMAKRLDPKRFHLPIASKAKQECLTLPHKVFLGGKEEVEDIAAAFAKVKMNYRSLRK
ncbi:MAG: DegT/DnrJ/EryC1/StrS family aminotransferase [Acidobacteria bacterium]|nr:DegT/DnrJ/EryC1/StrS family aminotransferase [Acidobacteriota bacterium]